MKITQKHIDRKARFGRKDWSDDEWFEPVSIRDGIVIGWTEDGAAGGGD